MKIINLQDRCELLPVIALAHVQAFGTLLPDWTLVQAEAELRAQQRDDIPCTWLAEDGSGWLGSVSLLHDDHEQIRGWSPWLASLYVDRAARGKGVGAALVAHCVAQARAMGVPLLYLYCEAPMVAWYCSLGWRVHAELQLGPLAITVMAVNTGSPDLSGNTDAGGGTHTLGA